MTTLPVVDLSQPALAGTRFLAHYAEGGGWTTQIILVNPTNNAVTGNIEFYSPGTSGSAGTIRNTVPYSVAGQSSFRFVAISNGNGTRTGSVRIVTGSGAAPVALSILL